MLSLDDVLHVLPHAVVGVSVLITSFSWCIFSVFRGELQERTIGGFTRLYCLCVGRVILCLWMIIAIIHMMDGAVNR